MRTAIAAMVRTAGMNNKAPILNVDWRQALTTREGALWRALSGTLVTANLNSLPLDWAARLSVGGTNLSYFIMKQLPVLRPDAYLEAPAPGAPPFVALIAPRAFELTYTGTALAGYAQDLGYEGPPFPWDEARRHALRSALDALYAAMYGLDRQELAWVLDAGTPSVSFPGLKQQEVQAFGEYRTRRLVLDAYDCLARDGTL